MSLSKLIMGNHQTEYNYLCNTGLKQTVIYLNNAIDVKTHDKFWNIAHQIVEPIVDTCQDVDWFIVVPEKHTEKERK